MVKHLAIIMHEALGSITSSTKKKKQVKKALKKGALLDSICPESFVPWESRCVLSLPCSPPHSSYRLVLFGSSSISWLYVPFTFLFCFGLNEKPKMNSTRVTLNQNNTPYAL